MRVAVEGAIFCLQEHGGISRIYHEILPRMADAEPSLEIHLLSPDTPRQSLPRHERIRLHRLPMVPWWLRNRYATPVREVSRSWDHLRAIGRSRFAIWHPTYYARSPFWKGPRVVLVPDMIHEALPELFTSREEVEFRSRKRRCIREADAVICISESTRSDVLRFIPGVRPERLMVVHLAHSDVFSHHDPPGAGEAPASGRPFMLTFASANLYKGHHDLLHAWRQWDGRRRYDLVIVGESPDVLGSPDAGARQSEPGLRRVGPVDDLALNALYRAALAFVYPSRYEGFGIPLLEAMACGCPVVASHIPSSVEVAGDVPVYFEPGDVPSLVAALSAVVNAPRTEARIRGLERARRFSWDRTADQVLNIYRRLI